MEPTKKDIIIEMFKILGRIILRGSIFLAIILCGIFTFMSMVSSLQFISSGVAWTTLPTHVILMHVYGLLMYTVIVILLLLCIWFLWYGAAKDKLEK